MTKNGTQLEVGQATVTHMIAVTEESSFGSFHCFAINKNGNASHAVELKKAGKQLYYCMNEKRFSI